MRIAIIGGKGLIGTSLAEECTRAGHEVILFTRRSTEGIGPGLQQWDGNDRSRLEFLLQNMDAVVNLAGENIGRGRWTTKRKADLLSSRLEPAEALNDVVMQMSEPPAVIIQASAVGYYGSGHDPVFEGHTQGTDFLAKLCGYWEDATLATDTKVRRVIIRSGVVLDVKGGILPQMALPFHLFIGGFIGSGKQWISWIHLRDEARAIRFLIENPKSRGIYNLTSPNPVTNAEFGKTLAQRINRPDWMRVPGFVLKAVLGEMSQLILEGQQVYPSRLQAEGFEFLYPTLKEALQDLYKS